MVTTAQGDLKATLAASVFFETTYRLLDEATTMPQLNAAAAALNSPAFDGLPTEERLVLGTMYAQRHYTITGALR